jgi:two-component system invasion response regulator UvrY
MRVLIADDHAGVRGGVKQTLLEEFSEIVFGEAATGSEAVSSILNGTWDLVIMDIAMPGRSGLETLKQLRELRPELPVLMFSMYPEKQYAVRALRAGAAGYLIKASIPEELVKAVHKILTGGKYVSAELAERLAAEVGSPSDKPPHEDLSDREYQILRLLAAGKSAKEIAGELGISTNTVSTYHVRIRTKMKMQTDAELTRYAVERKLLD